METKTIEQHFHVLGLEPGASLADVKEAYRFLVQTFHEDKYPADHPYRDRARNKMVELNDSYDQLKTFFQENPTGAPPGGWPKNPSPDEYRSADDAMDWKSWQQDQTQSWDSELSEWLAAEEKRRSSLLDDENRARRNLIVRTSKMMLIAAFGYLLMGHASGHAAHQANSQFYKDYLRGKLQYDLQTNGAANGAYLMTRDQILAQDSPFIERQIKADQDEQGRNSTSVVMLVLLGAGLVWVFRSKKAKALFETYIEGAKSPEQKEASHV